MNGRNFMTVSILVLTVAFLSVRDGGAANASGKRNSGVRHYRDVWGHAYKHQTNLFRDRDKNRVINLFEKNDRGKAPSQRLGKRPRKELISPMHTGKGR